MLLKHLSVTSGSHCPASAVTHHDQFSWTLPTSHPFTMYSPRSLLPQKRKTQWMKAHGIHWSCNDPPWNQSQQFERTTRHTNTPVSWVTGRLVLWANIAYVDGGQKRSCHVVRRWEKGLLLELSRVYLSAQSPAKIIKDNCRNHKDMAIGDELIYFLATCDD